MSVFSQVIFKRFARGAVMGAVSAMVVIAPIGITSFNELQPWLISLALAGTIGFISGGLQALDKAFRWEENPPQE